MARSLTARQQQVYDFIQERIALQGYGPTVREIGLFVGIKSPNGVMCHLRALERKGVIVRLANKSRAIEIAPLDAGQRPEVEFTAAQRSDSQLSQTQFSQNEPAQTPSLPLGSLAIRGCVAQRLCLLFHAPQQFDIAGAFLRTQRYLLEYSGSDLAGHSIADGDMLVIQPASEPAGYALSLVQSPDGSIELTALQSDEETDYSNQVVGQVVGVLRIHRPKVVKPPHLQLRKAQRA